MKTLYERLRELLAQGFFPDNFVQVAHLAEEASWQADRPLGLFTLAIILYSLNEDWFPDGSDQGIFTSSANEMARLVEPPILAYVNAAAQGNLSAEDEVSLLNGMLQAFFRWRASNGFQKRTPF